MEEHMRILKRGWLCLKGSILFKYPVQQDNVSGAIKSLTMNICHSTKQAGVDDNLESQYGEAREYGKTEVNMSLERATNKADDEKRRYVLTTAAEDVRLDIFHRN